MWSASSAVVDELELERNAAPFAASQSPTYPPATSLRPAASAFFNPGFNWSAPPKVPALSMPSFLKPSLAQTNAPSMPTTSLPRPLQASHHSNGHRWSHPLPTSPAAFAGNSGGLTDGLAIEKNRQDRAMPRPFDGSATNRATVSTRVWADGDNLEQVGNTVDSTGDISMAVAVAASPVRTAGQACVVGQGIVRVDRCIVSDMAAASQ